LLAVNIQTPIFWGSRILHQFFYKSNSLQASNRAGNVTL